MQTIYLDISNKGVYPCIYAKQGDVGRKFLAVITDNGVPFVIPETANVSAWYESKSSAGSFGSLSVTDNTVEVTIDQQMTVVAESGVVCVSVVYENGDEISTWNIPYDIESKPGINPIVPDQPSVSGSQIDDSIVSATKTWSSQKINGLVGDIETALDAIIAEQEAIIAIQEALIGGDVS